jgi:hypothetical protein
MGRALEKVPRPSTFPVQGRAEPYGFSGGEDTAVKTLLTFVLDWIPDAWLSTGKAVLAALVLAASVAVGWTVRGWKADAALKAEADAHTIALGALVEQARANQATAIAETRAALLAEARTAETQTIERIKYVQAAPAPAECRLPDATYQLLVDAVRRANAGREIAAD